MTDETPRERATPRPGKGTAPRAGTTAGQSGRSVPSREEASSLARYLVAAIPPADVRATASRLEEDQSCRVVRVLGGRGAPGGFPGVAVVEMTAEHAAMLAGYPGLHIEPDYAARLADVPRQPPVVTQRVTLEVLDDGMRPVEGAAITVDAPGVPVTGYTGPDGRAEITVPPQALAARVAIEARPPRGSWPVRARQPIPEKGGPMRLTCTRITTTHPDFPERALDSWGARVMGFGRLPPTYRGNGVRIALIGSGVATGHPDLSGRIERGRDLIGRDLEKGWAEDLTGTGTHYATLIAGRDDGTGIVGLAPEADVRVCRVTPGGSAAELIEALDYCIDEQVDLAMLDAYVPEPSVLLAAKMEEAWRNGTLCIAGAGPASRAAGGGMADGGMAGGASWPAASPRVLAVGAIGQLGTFPPDGTDTADVTGQLTPEGFFVPAFSTVTAPGIVPELSAQAPAVPAVDCCAPGVAVIAGLPPSSYGPVSGSGVAAAHVTALAALILAHHPMFRPEPGRPGMTRDAGRPARLVEVIRSSCRPLPQLDPARTGAGLPDAPVALGAAPWGAYPPISLPYPAAVPAPDGRTPLEPLTAAMRAAGLLAAE